MKPLILKLSPVSILSQAMVQTKKETHRGALTLQISFQGKTQREGLQLIIKRLDIKITIFLQLPSHVIPIFS